jgi:hypothetical protein
VLQGIYHVLGTASPTVQTQSMGDDAAVALLTGVGYDDGVESQWKFLFF